ncbi:MAG: branched-chain amino acid ABC transporter permease [Coriobacteriia bacterium]|nr:branched-chain amino acid ABC transporter permease [Coriobacteriia bacterium]
MSLDHIVTVTIGGLTVGMIYALVALGYTMVYGVLEFINFAHGEVFTVGGYVAAFTLFALGVSDQMSTVAIIGSLLLALVLSMAVPAALGLLVERVAYRPLRGRSRIMPLLSAIGVSIVLQQLIIIVFGPTPITMPTLGISSASVSILGARIRVLALVIITVSVVLMAGLTYLVKATRIGKAMRATSQDMEAAEMMGIETNQTIAFTFVVGSALAGIGGLLVIMYYGSLKFDAGFLYGLKAFTAAVLGGIGNIPGAVVGALVLGLTETYGVSMDLGFLAWFVVAGLLMGLYVQLVLAPKKRLQHISDDRRTPGYERSIANIYRLAPYLAVRTLVVERTDALRSVSARHAVRLMLGNLFLVVTAAVLFANGSSRIDTRWQPVIAFVVLMVILMFRPSGILGKHITEKV